MTTSADTSGTARMRGGDAAARMLGSLGPLAAFAALSGFAAAQWVALVAEPPVVRAVGVVLLATIGGAALGWSPRTALSSHARKLLRLGVTLLLTVSTLVVMGLPPALLYPTGWSELAAGVSEGLGGLATGEWPYAGPDPWVRLTILLAIPLTLSAAAALAFWPARNRAREAAGLALLLALYGVAVAQYAAGPPLVRGGLLLLLIAAWLFLPRLRRRGALAAAAMMLVALAAALPLAAGLTGGEPILDYRSWRWPGQPASYDWNHGYGPIDWPRRGETVLTVESKRPHYWRTAALDRYDGLRWVRSESAVSTGADPDLPDASPRRWRVRAKVTTGALETSLIAAPGAVRDVQGAGTFFPTRDGGARAEQTLEQGTEYTVRAYAPNPGAQRMRAAPEPPTYSQRAGTLIHLPPAGRTNFDVLEEGDDADASLPGRPVVLPRHGDGLGATPGAVEYVRESPYRRVYGLARRLSAGAPTTYDVVKRVESHLRAGYGYSERPPDREFPLAAFLFRDRVGYCQQFSGAMALLLRMNGVPARVVSGFAPGSRAADGTTFTVRDLDAHSWVEVHFSGIGWVPFDPTPSDSPAESRGDGTLASAARGAGAGTDPEGREAAVSDADRGEERADGVETTQRAAQPDSGRPSTRLIAAGLLAVGLVAGGGAVALRVRRARLAPDAVLRELTRALEGLGHPIAPGTTLMDLERRLDRGGRTAAARYVGGVRKHRYARARLTGDAAGRRALRSALTAGGGPLRRLRGLLLLPPRWISARFMPD